MSERFDPIIENRGYLADQVAMKEQIHGDYVKHEDYVKLTSQLAELHAKWIECHAQIHRLSKCKSEKDIQASMAAWFAATESEAGDE